MADSVFFYVRECRGIQGMNLRHLRHYLRQNLRLQPPCLLETYGTYANSSRVTCAYAHIRAHMHPRTHVERAVGAVGAVGSFIFQQVKKSNGVGIAVGFFKIAVGFLKIRG